MTGAVQIPPYPSLDLGNLSFPDGRYEPTVHSLAGGASVQVTHNLRGAPLLERLVDEGLAGFGCLLAVPLTGYRKFSLSESANAVQTVEWDPGVVGEPPILRPVLVSLDSFTVTLSDGDGVADIWRGRTVEFPKGARLARARYLRSVASLQSLLDIRLADHLPAGSFEVKSNENDGFRFSVDVAPDVRDFLSSSGARGDLYRSIGAHMVSMCFAMLWAECKADPEGCEEKWKQHSNLVMLSEFLAQRGLPHWSDGDFSADKVAMQLHPVLLPADDGEDD